MLKPASPAVPIGTRAIVQTFELPANSSTRTPLSRQPEGGAVATPRTPNDIMTSNPREQWERLQLMLQNRGKRGFGWGGIPGGGPRGNFGLVGSAILLGLGGYVLSNSLFNGEN